MLTQRVGPVAALVPAVLFAGFLLVQNAPLALGLVIGIALALEDDELGFLAVTQHVYQGVPSPLDLLFVCAIVATAVQIARSRERLRLPGPFTLPLLLLGVAFAGGAATGWFNNAYLGDMQSALTTAAYFLITPFLVVNVMHGRERVRQMAAAALVLAVMKGLVGCLGWVLGIGREVEDGVLTYYEPTANFLMLIFLLALVAVPIIKAPLPWWAKVAAPFVLAAFVLSFRRSFWIGGGLGLVILLLFAFVAETRRSRVLIPVVLILVLGGGAYVAAGPGGQNQLAERAESISPSGVQRDAQDRYRIDESRNVRAEIAEDPLTGIGLGVPWEARHSLAIQNAGGRQYSHVLVLWYWLKLGIVGLIGIVWLLAATLLSSYRLWRRGAEPWLRAAGLAVLCAFIGLLVAETTGSFTGVDLRFSILVGAILGWLAAAHEIKPA